MLYEFEEHIVATLNGTDSLYHDPKDQKFLHNLIFLKNLQNNRPLPLYNVEVQ